MRIESVQIQRYRAFDQRVVIPISDLTVLTGPNNLGKSTVLTALELFFSAFESRPLLSRPSRGRYSYEDDYPKRYVGRSGRRWPTQIRVRMALDAQDVAALTAVLGAPPSQTLEATVDYQWNDLAKSFRQSVAFAGVNSPQATTAIVSWLRANVRYVYIPAARNVQDFRRGTFGELIAGAVNRVRGSKQRLQALEKFYDDVKTELAQVETELASELQHYLPSVKRLSISIGELDLDQLVSVGDIEIDDGVPTNLQQKGDGFKSLFAISVLQYMARQRYGRNLVFGIEEPEAHLHSSAIYEIKQTLRTLAKSFQVLVTTHSPIFIERDNISANVIVESARGTDFASVTRVAKNLTDIRSSLGIRPHENMTTAEVVLVVEGATEERVMPAILGRIEPRLINALSSGRVRVLGAGGASSIQAVVRALARDATSCLVLVDGDNEGKDAADRIRNSGLLEPKDVFRVPQREGCPETEFEDLFDRGIYLPSISASVGLTLTQDEFADYQQRSGGRHLRHAKWSKVMAMAANAQSLDWDGIAEGAKTAFANAIVAKAGTIQTDQLEWSRAIAARLVDYLAEEGRS